MYMNQKSLAEKYGLSRFTIRRYTAEMESLGIYPNDTILKPGRNVLVNSDAFAHFLTYRKRLICEYTRKFVPRP